jgi:hypothetical protein
VWCLKMLKTSGCQINTVWTLGQASPISTRSWILVDSIWEVFAWRPDDVATCLDTTQRSRIFWVSFTDAKRNDGEDRPDAQPSGPDVVLLWEESRYSRKAVIEDRPDEGKLPSRRSTARVRICLELGFLKPINTWLDVHILILASAQVVCSIVHSSARLYPQGSVCKEKKINFYLN